jgi:hypothetical protein
MNTTIIPKIWCIVFISSWAKKPIAQLVNKKGAGKPAPLEMEE